jgi:hypothetical protein
MSSKKNPINKERNPTLNEVDGQSKKLEEKRLTTKKELNLLFGKDVNDPSERGHD